MKRTLKVITILSIIILTLILSNSVFAVYVQEVNGGDCIEYTGSNVTSTKQTDGSFLVELQGDANQDLVIRNGEVVTLDLNGHTLTNYTPACSTIRIEKGGKLIILDNSGTGRGTVTQKSGSTYSNITNLGTLEVKGGNISTTLNQYALRNEGTLTISGGTITGTSANTSVVGNILTENTADAKIVVKGGTITGRTAAVVNYTGCEIKVENGNVESTGRTAIYMFGGKANVTGGTLSSKSNIPTIEKADDAVAEIEITGGTFSGNVNEYIADNYASYEIGGKNIVGELKVTVEKDNYEVEVGKTAKLTIKVTIGDQDVTDKVTVKSTNEDAVKVENGNMVANAKGEAKIQLLLNGKTIKEIVVVAKEESTTPEEPGDKTEEPTDKVEEPEKPTEPIKPIEDPKKPETNKKDDTPTTGLGNTAIMLLSIVVIISLAGIMIFKKSKK